MAETTSLQFLLKIIKALCIMYNVYHYWLDELLNVYKLFGVYTHDRNNIIAVSSNNNQTIMSNIRVYQPKQASEGENPFSSPLCVFLHNLEMLRELPHAVYLVDSSVLYYQ